MSWPMIIGVAYISAAGALTLIGVRLVASNLSMRTVRPPIKELSARPLVMGLVALAIGGLMLLTTDRMIEAVAG